LLQQTETLTVQNAFEKRFAELPEMFTEPI